MNAYIDELTLITIPFTEVNEELSNFTGENTVTKEPLKIKKWLKNTEKWRYELYLSEPITLGTNYIVTANEKHFFHIKIGQVVRTKPFDDLYFYEKEDLGASYCKEATTFKIWAPTATEVEILLGEQQQTKQYPLNRREKGVWELTIDEDLEDIVYIYRICIDGQWQEAIDPYAVAVTVNGEKGVIIDRSKTDPMGWRSTKKPPFKKITDAIIYELHIRDFSIDETSGMKFKGKYEAFTEANTTGPWGTTTGVDHLIDLGVTHVQLLPVQDFGSVDEKKTDATYNWGYDTVNFNALEGSYSNQPTDPKQRIKELKAAILSLHSQGIRVIFDVVYNHVYIHKQSNLEKIVPGYYFRYQKDGKLADGTGVGNDIASERNMVRKFIVDSVLYWAKEFQCDGFRFDLMGNLDVLTMQSIREKLDTIDTSIITIGEGWDLSTPLSQYEKAIIANADRLPRIAFFNDVFRDSLKGSIFEHKQKGFCNGDGDLKERCKMLVSGSLNGLTSYDGIFTQPCQSVNYVECHDNHTLWDKLILSNGNDCEAVRANMHRLATAMTLLSQGIPFIHAGQEFFRSKQGVENSYNSPDEINKLDWKRKALHMDNIDYVKGLIALRKKFDLFRMETNEAIKKNIVFLETPPHCVAYMLKSLTEKIVVIHNGAEEEKEIVLPCNGEWEVLVEEGKAQATSIKKMETTTVKVSPISTTVLYGL